MGLIITCINCRKQILELVHEVHAGDVVSASQFKGFNGYPDPQPGDRAVCPNCDYDLKPSVEAVI